MLASEIPDLRLVDAHFHLWDVRRAAYPWLSVKPHWDGLSGDITSIAGNYLLDDYAADQGRWTVQGAVHVEAGRDPEDSVGESRWLQSVADSHGLPSAIVAAASLERPGAEHTIAGHCEMRNVRGIRQNLNWHEDPSKSAAPHAHMMSDPSWLAGFALLEKYGLSFDLQIYPSQLAAAAELASRHPSVQIILNHAGLPIEDDPGGLARWRAGMRALAVHGNVQVKICGLGMLNWRWTVNWLRPYVLHTIDSFGIDRCMFGSNFPVDRLYSSFDALYDAYADIVRDFRVEEQRRLFGENAVRIYRIQEAGARS